MAVLPFGGLVAADVAGGCSGEAMAPQAVAKLQAGNSGTTQRLIAIGDVARLRKMFATSQHKLKEVPRWPTA